MQERNNVTKFHGEFITLVGNVANVGTKAEDFTAVNPDMTSFQLSDCRGKIVLINSFPSIDTPICSLQTAKFNAEAEKLPKDKVIVLSISADLPFAIKRYIGQENISNLKAISDYKDLSFGYKYGFVIKELRLLSRGVVIIDKEGIIKYAEYCSDISTEPNYKKAVELLKSLI